MNALESDLKRLPEPALPEGLSASITARIARVDEERAAAALESPRVVRTESGRARLAWAAALAGATVGLGAQAYRLAVGEAALDLTSPRLGGLMTGVVEMLPATPAAAFLAMGLLLYLAGLFAPLRDAGRSGQGPAI